MLPFLTLVGARRRGDGHAQLAHHYFVPALAPATFNVATIVVRARARAADAGARPAAASWRIAIGALVGGLGQIAVQWPPLRREGFRYRADARRARSGPAPGAAADGAGHDRPGRDAGQPASSTRCWRRPGHGAVSWLQYAFRLMYLPIGLFGVSIATAVLPAVARHAAVDDRAAVARTVARGIALMLMVNVPATLGLIVLADADRAAAVRARQFLPADTVATAAAVRCYAVGLVGYSAARIASPVFYALGRSRVPVALSTVDDRRQPRAEPDARARAWGSAGWRSPRRWPRSSTAALSLVAAAAPARRPRRRAAGDDARQDRSRRRR